MSTNQKELSNIGERMLLFAKYLFPLNRSIMGPDIRKNFEEFIKINPEFKILNFETGEKVFDWEIPDEWIIRDAYIEHQSGKRFGDFKKNNLHLMGYSEPIEKTMKKEDLIQNIHTLPDLPDAIPYVTSYYKKKWAFCLSHEEFLSLPEGNYKVVIDSEFKKGNLSIIEAIFPGKSSKEIFFSSYLCHPSMANNELSGPVVLNEIMNFIRNKENRFFTYRFVLLPETIGSIAYLSRKINDLKKFMYCGFNLTCVGDDRGYSHVSSRLGANLADNALKAALIDLENVKKYSFLSRGSDERQYCAPGVDLPLCTFCRTKFGNYPEYHTSKDDFSVVTSKGLKGAYDVMINIIDAFELGLYPKIKVICEPQLGKRGLYPTTSKLYKGKHPARTRMDIISYCDAENNIFQICEKVNTNLALVIQELKQLKNKDLLDFRFSRGI